MVVSHFDTLSKTDQRLQSLGQSVSSAVNEIPHDSKQLELSRSIFLQLQKKLTELKDQCQELEKKKHQSKFFHFKFAAVENRV